MQLFLESLLELLNKDAIISPRDIGTICHKLLDGLEVFERGDNFREIFQTLDHQLKIQKDLQTLLSTLSPREIESLRSFSLMSQQIKK